LDGEGLQIKMIFPNEYIEPNKHTWASIYFYNWSYFEYAANNGLFSPCISVFFKSEIPQSANSDQMYNYPAVANLYDNLIIDYITYNSYNVGESMYLNSEVEVGSVIKPLYYINGDKITFKSEFVSYFPSDNIQSVLDVQQLSVGSGWFTRYSYQTASTPSSYRYGIYKGSGPGSILQAEMSAPNPLNAVLPCNDVSSCNLIQINADTYVNIYSENATTAVPRTFVVLFYKGNAYLVFAKQMYIKQIYTVPVFKMELQDVLGGPTYHIFWDGTQLMYQ